MSKLPVISGEELVRVLRRVGYVPHHQKGSHLTMKLATPSEGRKGRVTIPMHREIKRGTLKNILKDAGLSVDELLELL